jgi:anti-sigma regulatory factor (Ser/Thr protein kinase)
MLDQQFNEAALHIVRETVLAHAAAAGMPERRAVDVMLAVHELAANAVRHGGGSGRIRMQVTGGELVCRVSDPGPASRNGQAPGSKPDRRQHPAGSTVPAQPWPCQPGHGLWLVRQAADHISVISGPAGSQVTAVFALVPGNVAGDFAGP